MRFVRRLTGCALAVGALLFSAVVPAWGAVPAATAATTVGPVRITVQGFGSGPSNIAYQESIDTAYGKAEATYGYSASQCAVSWGPYEGLSLPNGYTEWLAEVTCTGDPVVTSTTLALTRYWNGSSDHRSTTWNVPDGFTAETVLGKLYPKATAGTQPLYMCKVGNDTFTSPDVNCEGKSYVTRLGWIYSAPPSGVATRAVRRCRIGSNGEHFDSLDPSCEGQIAEGVLGYALV